MREKKYLLLKVNCIAKLGALANYSHIIDEEYNYEIAYIIILPCAR